MSQIPPHASPFPDQPPPQFPPAVPRTGMSTSTKLLIGCAVLVGAIILFGCIGLIAVGMLVDSDSVPDTAALPKGKIPAVQIERLRELNIIEIDEEVQFFYSTGLFSIDSDGNLFTDRRVISYEGLDGELQIASATYSEIESFEFYDSDDWLDDSTITVYKKDGDWFMLLVSPEGGRDAVFFQQLEEMWNRNKTP